MRHPHQRWTRTQVHHFDRYVTADVLYALCTLAALWLLGVR